MNNTFNPSDSANQDGLRIALVSTPRSGNTWLRNMLAAALDLQEVAAHNPRAVNWNELPPRLVLQMHWHRDAQFVDLLREHGFRVVVISRHPLDVLLSILMFVQHERETAAWLDGLAGDERELEGASPLDGRFLKYATGERARALLDVGAQWSRSPDTVQIRYEDLVNDTHGQVSGLLASLHAEASRPLGDVISRFSPEGMRSTSVDLQFHVWHARPGLWKCLIPSDQAQAIYQAQQEVFQALGHTCDRESPLAPPEAEAAWIDLEQATLKRNVFELKRKLNEADARHVWHVQSCSRELQSQLGDLDARQHAEANRQQLELARQQAELGRQQGVLDGLRSERDWLRTEVESLKGQLAGVPLAQLRELGPWSLGAASALHRGSKRFPHASAGIKSLARFCRRTLSHATRLKSSVQLVVRNLLFSRG